ncbi:ATP-binding protein [Hymenobacter rubidus]|uniref:ATP-binding protein n=1 Tax=Hymenobacter rubidus TaxID=1441626 RepID=UPI00191D0034|nr:ATP-binding protein [Hymenobacter rubidus]
MERTTFPGTLDSLEGIRLVVKEQAQQAGLAKKPTYALLLAVDEIATNIITHGYDENGGSGPVDVLISHADGKLSVTLEDDAVAFDPLKHTLPDEQFFAQPLENRPIGGMGIHLTLNGVDEFKYEYVNHRNRNTFIMKTEPASAPA